MKVVQVTPMRCGKVVIPIKDFNNYCISISCFVYEHIINKLCRVFSLRYQRNGVISYGKLFSLTKLLCKTNQFFPTFPKYFWHMSNQSHNNQVVERSQLRIASFSSIIIDIPILHQLIVKFCSTLKLRYQKIFSCLSCREIWNDSWEPCWFWLGLRLLYHLSWFLSISSFPPYCS